MFAPGSFNSTYYALLAVVAIPSFSLAIAWLVKTLLQPAAFDGSAGAKAVFAGLNETGVKVFLLLFLVCWPLCWIPWRFVACWGKQGSALANPNQRWIWPTAKTQFAMLALAVSLMSYVGTYTWLSRRGMHEAEASGVDGFFYVPTAEIMATEDLQKHLCLAVFFAPVNAVDRSLFHGTYPVRSVVFRLSYDEPQAPLE